MKIFEYKSTSKNINDNNDPFVDDRKNKCALIKCANLAIGMKRGSYFKIFFCPLHESFIWETYWKYPDNIKRLFKITYFDPQPVPKEVQDLIDTVYADKDSKPQLVIHSTDPNSMDALQRLIKERKLISEGQTPGTVSEFSLYASEADEN